MKLLRSIFVILAIASFLFAWGTIGGMESNTITAGEGALKCFLGLLGMIIFTHLSEEVRI